MDTENTKIGFIGCGSMGSAIIHAVCKKFNPQNIKISAKHFEHAKKVADAENCIAAASNAEAANGSKYIFSCKTGSHKRNNRRNQKKYSRRRGFNFYGSGNYSKRAFGKI